MRVQANQVNRAVDMYCNLRQFDKAREIIPENDIESAKALMKLQAEWCKTSKDPKACRLSRCVFGSPHGSSPLTFCWQRTSTARPLN